jgi:ferrous iron transport protein B
LESKLQTARLNASYAGHMGKWIEPLITPLGFDWKIGIAIITSFAAREVFVGTMATIYSVGSNENPDFDLLRQKMSEDININTGGKLYTTATGLSLIMFYVFAMQCMSTLAIVRRETKSWKWPCIQFLYLTILAWGASFITYTLLS